jgi:hypothetical protein
MARESCHYFLKIYNHLCATVFFNSLKIDAQIKKYEIRYENTKVFSIGKLFYLRL